MLLQNVKAPNMKFSIGGDVVAADKNGIIEVTAKDAIEALLASGFTPVKAVKKSAAEAPKPEKEAEEMKEIVDEVDEKLDEKPKTRIFKRGS